MKSFFATALAALTPVALAAKCQNLTIPVSVSSRNGVFNLASPSDNIATIDFSLNLARQGHNYSNEIITGYNTVSGDYEIEATYCEPDSGPGKVIQILTHGIGFDRSYWDFSFANYNYSYVREAVDQYGYSTFSYDRLGIGQSTHFKDPVNEGQVWIELAALKYLTTAIRNKQISGISASFEKVVHAGHSFGAIQTYTLAATNPDLTDGIILQGFSQNSSFTAFFILGSNFIVANSVSALSSYATGYLAPASVTGAQIDFFAPGDFDPAVLMAAYATGQPVTPGELLTIGAGTGAPSPFTGPALVITGERDIPFCGGDCFATGNPSLASIPAASAKFLASASPFEAFVVPGSGHGLNLEYSHPTTYATMLNFLAQNGLASKGSGWKR